MHWMTRLIVAAAMLPAATLVSAQSQTTTSRVYFFNPHPAEIQASLQGLEEALSARKRVQKQVNLVPTVLPDRLGEPVSKMMQFGPASLPVQDCGDAYATISLVSDTDGGILGGTGERIFGCMYLSKAGIRTAIVMEQYTRSSTLFGGLVSAIRKGTLGDDPEFGKKVFGEFATKIRARTPDVLVELIELPGGDISRPDGERVAAILAESKTSAAPPPNAAAPGAAGLLSITPLSTSAQQPQQAPPPSPMVQAVEARKQLVAMGLSYHSVEQFHDAIKRGDLIAVDLFVQAGAVRGNAKDAGGHTAPELAAQVGDAQIVEAVARLSR